MTLASGTKLGRYEILSKIGAGGMGEVYLAHDTGLNRKVALKVLPAGLVDKRARLHRFEQEAQASSALNHPNIITIHEIGEENGHQFIATEFIEGETLRERLRGGIDVDETLEIAIQVASALVAAHRVNIIHRDIKPENIMIRKDDGLVKVLDFGLAKITVPRRAPIDPEADTEFRNTAPGVVMGTVAYMSPEQARGKDVDARTDIFSLGAIVYEMLSGRAPFAGETGADIIGALIHKEPQSLCTLVPNAPAEMQYIVNKMLRKNPEDRYETVKNLLVDLKTLKQDLDFTAKLDRSVSPESKRAKGPGTDSTENEQKMRVPVVHGLLRRPSQRSVALVGLLTTILLIAVVYNFWKQNSKVAGEKQFKALAVLPFKPLTTDSRDESFEMGMAESIITNLSGISQIVVRPMNSVRKYTDLEQDPAQAGRELQVDAVLHGTIQKTYNQVRVTVRLLDVQTGATLWADRFDEDLTHIFQVQDSISERLTRALKLRLTGEEQTNVTKRHTNDVEAYQLYLQGKYLWHGRQREDLWKSLEYFQRAIDKDPNFALAYIGLAESNLSLLGRMLVPAHEAIPKAVAAMTKALEIDPKLAEAHNTLAEIKYQFQYDWPGAEREFKQAVELNPNNAFIHLAYGWSLMMASRFEEAEAEMDRAQELDPSSMTINRARGRLFYFSRQVDRAIQRYQKILEVEPDLGVNHDLLGLAYMQKGMHAEAVEELSKAAKLHRPDRAERIEVLRNTFTVLGWQAYLEKRTAEFEERAKTAYVAPHLVALYYAQLGKNDEAFSWLEKALESRDPAIVTLRVEPLFDGLRSDPRYSTLLRQINMM